MQIGSASQSVIYSSQDSNASGYLSKLIWIVIILTFGLFNLYNFFINPQINIIFPNLILIVGLIYLLFSRFFINLFGKKTADPAEVFKQKTYTFEDLFLSFYLLLIITTTGNLTSPFFYILFLPLLVNVFTYKLSSYYLAIAMTLIVISTSIYLNQFSLLLTYPFQPTINLITLIFTGFVISVIKQPLPRQKERLDFLTAENSSLKSLNLELQSILQSIQEGLIITNTSGIILLSNKRAEEILMTSSNYLNNKPIFDLLHFTDLAGKINSFEVETKTITNQNLRLKISSFPLIENSNLTGTIYLISDITKEAELETIKLDFVAQAVHQLRTPLSILKDYLIVFSENMKGKLSKEDELYLDRSVIGAKQLASLIENLLNVSNIEKGNLQSHLQSFSIEKVVEENINSLNNLANQKSIRLIYQKPQYSVSNLSIDPTLISEAINNIIVNAINFSHKESEIKVWLEEQKDQVVFNVQDFGVGIPANETDKIFNKFHKVSGSLIQASKGIGLGLYNTKAIVEAHHGKIWVNSILGQGSTFSFSLPVPRSSQ